MPTTTITARAHVNLSVDVDMRRHPSDIHTPRPLPPTIYTSPPPPRHGTHFPPTVTQLHQEQRRLSPSVKHIQINWHEPCSVSLSLSDSACAALLLCRAIVGERGRAVYFLSINSRNRVSAANSMQRHICKALRRWRKGERGRGRRR